MRSYCCARPKATSARPPGITSECRKSQNSQSLAPDRRTVSFVRFALRWAAIRVNMYGVSGASSFPFKILIHRLESGWRESALGVVPHPPVWKAAQHPGFPDEQVPGRGSKTRYHRVRLAADAGYGNRYRHGARDRSVSQASALLGRQIDPIGLTLGRGGLISFASIIRKYWTKRCLSSLPLRRELV